MSKKITCLEHGLMSMQARLLEKSYRDEKTGCLIYTGPRDDQGYGIISLALGDGTSCNMTTHRASAFLAGIIESLDDPGVVCHKVACSNTSCIEPLHLYKGDVFSNNKDTVFNGNWKNQHTGKTHCKRGHPMDGIRPKGRGRYCKACRIIHNTRKATA